MIALMKLTSAIYCEVILIIMISHVDNVSDIIKDFVALGFIVEIDDMFAKNMKGICAEEIIEEFSELEILNEKSSIRDFKQLFKSVTEKLNEPKSRPSWLLKVENAVIYVTYTVCNELYIVIYYYSFFYLVMILNNFYYED